MRRSSRDGLHRWLRGLAALLLALQALSGGAAALVHAAESSGGPATLESRHGAQCVTLHDVARCVQCQYAGTRVLPVSARLAPAADAGRHVPLSRARPDTPQTRDRQLGPPPRAPPLIQS
ncbi:MAG: hypothetical protein ACREMF_04475 [Gemmatimonadales bacterium]